MYPDQTTQAEGPQRDYREDEGMLMKAAEDKPLSSSETAMMDLEQEIAMLDEELSMLSRKLKPVQDNSIEKAAAAGVGSVNEARRRPISPMAQSIDEKANRIRQIRSRLRSLTNSVDL